MTARYARDRMTRHLKRSSVSPRALPSHPHSPHVHDRAVSLARAFTSSSSISHSSTSSRIHFHRAPLRATMSASTGRAAAANPGAIHAQCSRSDRNVSPDTELVDAPYVAGSSRRTLRIHGKTSTLTRLGRRGHSGDGPRTRARAPYPRSGTGKRAECGRTRTYLGCFLCAYSRTPTNSCHV